MIIYFGTFDKRKKVKEVKTIKELFDFIHEDIKRKKLKFHYTRINFLETEWEIDFGSWSEFYYVADLPEDAREQLDKLCEEGKDDKDSEA